MSDDLDRASMLKAITVSSQRENGEKKAKQASKSQDANPNFWSTYANNVLNFENNYILELTIGAGWGTNAVMRNMKSTDYYMGVDIDFICAKNADALAKYYEINGLGIATSLWNLPFEDAMFTAVCSNMGLEECREIPTILEEAVRVLMPKGKMILCCRRQDDIIGYSYLKQYGFSEEETMDWLNKVRLYADTIQIESLLCGMGMRKIDQITDAALRHILVFEK